MNTKYETLFSLNTFKPHLDQRCLLLRMDFMRRAFCSIKRAVACFVWLVCSGDEAGVKQYTMRTTSPNKSVGVPNTNWSDVTDDIQYDGTNLMLFVAPPIGSRFYRLLK